MEGYGRRCDGLQRKIDGFRLLRRRYLEWTVKPNTQYLLLIVMLFRHCSPDALRNNALPSNLNKLSVPTLPTLVVLKQHHALKLVIISTALAEHSVHIVKHTLRVKLQRPRQALPNMYVLGASEWVAPVVQITHSPSCAVRTAQANV